MQNLLKHNAIFLFLKFGIVGFMGLIVDFGITYIFKEILRVNKFVSNALGFLLAASSNYILNRIWTFKSENPDVFQEFGKFFIVSIIGLGINSAVLWFCNEKLKINFYISKIFAVIVATMWNFLANWLYTFS
ncbi:MAG: GtrA family protein [Bacteroidales bacterium]|jgi:putative flippase GtrA|nr:GtrA family protein [Bacteroidales bacterium]